MKFKLIEAVDSVWYHNKDKFNKHILELITNRIQYVNKQLDKYGFEVTYVKDYDFDEQDNKWIAVFCGEIQDNASEFPISINIEYFYNECLEDEYIFYDLSYHIEKSIWHEVGHGIQNYLFSDYEYTDIERSAEEFAEYMMDETNDCELLDCLHSYENEIDESVSLDNDGNFVSNIDANFKMGENYHLFDFDFKKITPDMYKTVEEQSFANTDDFKDEYAVSWWDGDKLVAVVSEFDDAYGKRWLSYIEVTEPYRGHNLSTELLNYAVNGLGCTMLGVAKSNKVAIKVYQDYGFKIIGDNPNNKNQYWMQTISSLQKESNKLKEDYSKDTKIGLKIENQKVGKAMIRDYQDGEIFLTDFEILPEFRGKGYGKKSFDMLVNQYGVNSLTVNPENSIALNMYKKFGFKQASEPYYDENGNETVIYMKRV